MVDKIILDTSKEINTLLIILNSFKDGTCLEPSIVFQAGQLLEHLYNKEENKDV